MSIYTSRTERAEKRKISLLRKQRKDHLAKIHEIDFLILRHEMNIEFIRMNLKEDTATIDLNAKIRRYETELKRISEDADLTVNQIRKMQQEILSEREYLKVFMSNN